MDGPPTPAATLSGHTLTTQLTLSEIRKRFSATYQALMEKNLILWDATQTRQFITDDQLEKGFYQKKATSKTAEESLLLGNLLQYQIDTSNG